MNLNLAVFASGAGSNTRAILQYFSGHPKIRIAAIVSNVPEAGSLSIARDFNIPLFELEPGFELDYAACMQWLDAHQVQGIILAGFLKKVSLTLIHRFTDKILNIHPSLLPEFGGKGMYGMHVHEAVFKASKPFSGITIHLVNEEFDAGRILLQVHTPVHDADSPEEIAARIRKLEHYWFPRTIEWFFTQS